MRIRTPLTLPVLAAAGALALAACGAGGSTAGTSPAAAPASTSTSAVDGVGDGQPRTVEHAMGTTEVPADAERVVVLDTGELDAVVSLGVTPVGAVTTDVSTSLVAYLEDELADTRPVGTIGEPNLEAIAAARPDLILSNTVRHEDLYDELSAIAPTVMAGDVGDSWKDTLRLAADSLGETERAEQLLADYESRAQEVGREVADGDPAGTEVSVVRFLPGQIRLYTPTSFIGTVLDDAGFARPASQLEGDTWVEASQEQLATADGDVLFYSAYGDPADTDLAAVTGGPLWAGLGAVERQEAHEVSDDTWFLGIGVTAANLVLDDLEQVLAAR